MSGCLPPSLFKNAYMYIVLAPSANPFAYRWILPAQRGFDAAALNGIGEVDFVGSQRAMITLQGASIHPGDNPQSEYAVDGAAKSHHISIYVNGEIPYPPDAPPDNGAGLASTVQSSGNQASLLKCRATLAMGNARQRVFDFDLGAGVEFDVVCQAVQNLEVLIPDPRDPPPLQPAEITDDPRALATVLSTAVYPCTPTLWKMPLTYSQVFLLGPLPHDQAWMPVVPEAREVAVYVDETGAAAGGVVVEFVYVLGILTEPTVGPIADPFVVVGEVVLPAGAAHVPRTLIPGQTNAFRITRTFGSDDTAINIVQVLNV